MMISKACTPALMGAVAAGIFAVLQLLSLTGSVYECFWGVPEAYLAFVPLVFINLETQRNTLRFSDADEARCLLNRLKQLAEAI